MQILDLDLDFFLDKISHWNNDYDSRLDNKFYFPWGEAKVRHFLENQCNLSTHNPIKGRVVDHHHEAFWFWRELIDGNLLDVPFEIVHVDAHSDLGLGDTGYEYIMTELLHKLPGDRMNPDVDKLKPGNFLAFVVACQWVRKITFVLHPLWGDDLMGFHFKNCDIESGYLQLKKCDPEELNDYLDNIDSNLKEIPFLDLEPEVQFETILGSDYQNNTPFSFVLLSHSPGYTPESSDYLIPVIKEYIDEI